MFKDLFHFLIEKKLSNIRIPLTSTPLALNAPKTILPAAYANDTNNYLKISNRQESETITGIFLDLKIATGLSINPSKTLIVTPVPEKISPEAKDALSLWYNSTICGASRYYNCRGLSNFIQTFLGEHHFEVREENQPYWLENQLL